jgi:hypothetical protein
MLHFLSFVLSQIISDSVSIQTFAPQGSGLSGE